MQCCTICGRHPAKFVSFKAHQGFLVFRTETAYEGVFCRDHALEAYAAARGKTLKGMWFGPASLTFGILRSVWDSAKLLDLPDEVRDEPWMQHIVACPQCGGRNATPAGCVGCGQCRQQFVVGSCAKCGTVHVLWSAPVEQVCIECPRCSRRTRGAVAIRNSPALLIGVAFAEVAALVSSADRATGVRDNDRHFRKLLQTVAGLDEASLDFCCDHFEQALTNTQFDHVAKAVQNANEELPSILFGFAVTIAECDGSMSASEFDALAALATLLKLNASEFLKSRREDASVDWPSILGISRDATLDVAKRAYKQLAFKHHPDRQATDDERRMAQIRLAKINLAWNAARAEIERRNPHQPSESESIISPEQVDIVMGDDDVSTSPQQRAPTKPTIVRSQPERSSPNTSDKWTSIVFIGGAIALLILIAGIIAVNPPHKDLADNNAPVTLHDPRPRENHPPEPPGAHGTSPQVPGDPDNDREIATRRSPVQENAGRESTTPHVPPRPPDEEPRPHPPDDNFSRGMKLQDDGRLEDSIAVFSEAIEHDDSFHSARARYYRGIAYYRMHLFQGAIADLNHALAHYPRLIPSTVDPKELLLFQREYANATGYRGLCFYEMKHYKDAARDFTDAMDRDPRQLRTWPFMRGNSRKQLKLNREAIRDYTQAIRRDPKFAAAFLQRGIAHEQLGEYAAAITDLEEAKRLGESVTKVDEVMDRVRERLQETSRR